MILYARLLDASATVMGIIAGMMPLLVIFQIPAARHIARVGYRRFVFAGWGTRVSIIFLIALVPLTGGFLSAGNRLALLLFLLFAFNLSRGISSAAWLPWIAALVPAERRGHYLARDSACVNTANCVILSLSGFVLGPAPTPIRFAVIFVFSALMGLASLVFLKRIPDVPRPAETGDGSGEVPWGAIAAHPPFRKLLLMNVAWSVAYGGMIAFTVAYLRAAAGMTENRVLYVTAISFLGGLGGMFVFGRSLDRHGSKPALVLVQLIWVGILTGWTLLSGGLLPVTLRLVIPLGLGMGFGYAVFSMANTRLAMTIVPPMGRDHFFALFSVVGNLTLGLSPVFWGLLIDAFGARVVSWGSFSLNRFSLFFLLVTAMFLITGGLCRRLDEPRAAQLPELLRDLLAQRPLRSWVRLWPRG